jgi:hypothetical protein
MRLENGRFFGNKIYTIKDNFNVFAAHPRLVTAQSEKSSTCGDNTT